MKKILARSAFLLILTLMIAVMPTEAEAGIYEDTVRLHILAASDSDEDQALKYALRDALFEKYRDVLGGAEDAKGAELVLEERLFEIEEFARRFVRERGYEYEVKATLSTEWYDTRDYEYFSLPMGYYRSLRIIIGEGAGKNWWCVMYPPLCTEIATDAPRDDALGGYTKEEASLVSGGRYTVKFKSLEIISRAFRKK